MKPVRELFRKFQSSDGRAKAVTASGVLLLAVAVALAVGVLPAMGSLGGSVGPEVDAVQVDWGGGSGACDDALVSLEDGTSRGPSAARHELHVQNPKTGSGYFGSDGTEFKLTVTHDDTKVDIEMVSPTGGNVFYDIVINGGKKSNHYDFDNNDPAIFVSGDDDFMAPEKDNKVGEFHKISHINVCYDLQPTLFECGGDAEAAILLNEDGVSVNYNFTDVSASIFTTSDADCDGFKFGFFFKDNTDTDDDDPDVLLDFGDEGTVAGRMDITKQYEDTNTDTNNSMPPEFNFQALEYYDTNDPSSAVEISWCDLVPKGEKDGDQFDDVIDPNDELAPEDTLFPDATNATALSDGNVACKVAELRYADGKQVSVLYILFKDPHFF